MTRTTMYVAVLCLGVGLFAGFGLQNVSRGNLRLSENSDQRKTILTLIVGEGTGTPNPVHTVRDSNDRDGLIVEYYFADVKRARDVRDRVLALAMEKADEASK